ncbi:hypothetical protein [Methylorubrum populi]
MAKVKASAAVSGRLLQDELPCIGVRAVTLAGVRIVRSIDLYPAEGDDEEKRADAKCKVFNRALASATRHPLIGSVELRGLNHIWLKPDAV